MGKFKTWWEKNKDTVIGVTLLTTMAVGGAVAYVKVCKYYNCKANKIIDSVKEDTRKALGMIDLPKPEIKGCYIHDFWCENAEPGSGMGVKAVIAVDTAEADVGEVFRKLAEAGNVDTELNGFWATVEWDCND